MNNHNLLFTWNKNWISPFESPWSIIQKFNYSNNISIRDFFSIFGIQKIKLKRNNIEYMYLNLINRINDELFSQVFDFSLRQYNFDCINQLSGVLSKSNNFKIEYSAGLFRDNLHFCSECIKEGYHSYFFQYKLIHECPYHLTPLESKCPNCNEIIPYKIISKHIIPPFSCRCGFNFLKNDSFTKISLLWESKRDSQINSTKVKKWITLNEAQSSKLKNIYFFDKLDLDKYPDAMDHILCLVDKSFISTNSKLYNSIFTSTNISEFNSCNNNDIGNSKEYRSIHEFPYSKYIEFVEDIYNSSAKTVSAIIKHVKTKILIKHKYCIRQIINMKKNMYNYVDHSVCPFAFAYLSWVREINGLEYMYKVDNYGYRKRLYTHKYSLEVASYLDQDILINLISDWLRHSNFIDPDRRTTLKWIINRVISFFVLNHFNNWLKISRLHTKNDYSLSFYNIIYESIPFFLIVFPNNNKEPMEIHWWTEDSHQTLSESNQKCSFSKTKVSKIDNNWSQIVKNL